MHFGRGNPKRGYYIGSGDKREFLEKTKTEKYLGLNKLRYGRPTCGFCGIRVEWFN